MSEQVDEILLEAEDKMDKAVDGVYDADPRTHPDARRFDRLSHDDVLSRDLKVADGTAISLCRDNDLPILVFDLLVEGNIARAVRGERIGTLVTKSGGTSFDARERM